MNNLERAYWALKRLSDHHHEALKVGWSVGMNDVNITFHSFSRYVDSPKGNGAKALRDVCQLADVYGIDLRLWTIYPKLIPYYQSFGFAASADSNADCWRGLRSIGAANGH